MALKEIKENCSFHCVQCEKAEKEPLSNLESCCLKDQPAKIWVRNLPCGISESGVKNLFITAGKPKSIKYYFSSNSAIVEFDCIKKLELAMRDLDCKPPYNLKLSSAVSNKNQPIKCSVEENWDFSNPPEKVYEDLFQAENITEVKNEQLEKAKSQLEDMVNKFGYDPSIRMRQKKLDFTTDTKCISLGRGYINMGEANRYVGGLQNYAEGANNGRAKAEANNPCQNCGASTTKMCHNCLKSYCSKVCLSMSPINHKNCSAISDNKEELKEKDDLKSSLTQQNLYKSSLEHLNFDQYLTSGCTVVMSTYLTMESVFVRRSDKEWKEKFIRLCNDVAEVVLNDDKLDSTPKVNEMYIAKYYKDLCFYRARVSSVNQKKANVMFVDFGNSQETNFQDLKPLPDHLKSVPALAVKVHLSDMTVGSSLDSVDYYNRLTAEKTPLILEFKEGSEDVILKEKDSKLTVNEVASNYSLPSWKKNKSVISKTGEVFFKNSLMAEELKVGETCSLTLCHFDEKEFLESEVFWVSLPDTDHFFHVNTEMQNRITEYCEFLKNDYYLPRTNELCLVEENGKWHRCVNLKTNGTTCCVFFIDDGHSSFTKTNNIRKMIQDFTEVPAQAICCTLPDDSRLRADKELSSKVIDYLKSCLRQKMDSIRVLKLMGDAYCLFIPEIQKILT